VCDLILEFIRSIYIRQTTRSTMQFGLRWSSVLDINRTLKCASKQALSGLVNRQFLVQTLNRSINILQLVTIIRIRFN